jgi:Peptidase family M28/PA domain
MSHPVLVHDDEAGDVMTPHRETVRQRWLRVALSAAVLTTTAGLVPLTTSTADAATPKACEERVNNTAAKLVECITTADLWRHMKAFQRIADANPGPDGHPSRNSGEPGYKASVDYVAKRMKEAGYNVTIQTYTFPYFSFVGTPVLKQVSPTVHDYGLGVDFNPGQAAGTATAAPLQPAGGIVIPPTNSSSSLSGCAAADFTGFTAGRIALIQRGGCTFGTKATNAQAAGASGVIIFNEGNPGRTGLLSGSLVLGNGSPAVLSIPVAFTPFAVGSDLLTQYQQATSAGTAGPALSMDVKSIENPNALDYNVIAESKGGDPNSVLVVDAHLDAIYGAGMLDNASGSAAILDIAEQMKNVKPRNKLRFIWFGGEELGLLGSNYYIDNLPPTELAKIGFDLDADVLGTPNYVAGVLDPEGVQLFTRGPGTPMSPTINAPSRVARDFGIDYLTSIGKKNILFSADGTDAFVFHQAGIPASGVLTGQDCCKLPSDVDLFGGQTGNFEGNLGTTDGGCVDNPFRWCDNLSNNDPAVLTFMSKTFATMVAKMAFDTTVLHPGNHGGKKDTSTHHSPRGREDE